MNEEKRKLMEGILGLLGKSDNPDSLEIGAPSKGGVVKVYGNFEDTVGFRNKIDAALSLRSYARKKMEVE